MRISQFELEKLIKERFGTYTEAAKVLKISTSNFSNKVERQTKKFLHELKLHGVNIPSEFLADGKDDYLDLLASIMDVDYAALDLVDKQRRPNETEFEHVFRLMSLKMSDVEKFALRVKENEKKIVDEYNPTSQFVSTHFLQLEKKN